MKVNLKFWQETYSHLKLCCLENLKKHVPLKPYKEREAGTLSCWGQKFEFLHIFEKSTEGLKDFYAKSVSSAHQNFLITQRQRQVHTHLMSEGREVDYEVTLSRNFCWPFFFFFFLSTQSLHRFTNVNQVEILWENSIWWPGPLLGISS